jgi:aspartate carbamoyltransferase catalytic subunit
MARIYAEACSTSAIVERDSLMSDSIMTEMTDTTLYGGDIISMQDLSLQKIELILETARKLKIQPAAHLLKNKVIAHCFFEPSTRTRLSFETATLRLGGNVIGFSSDEALSIRKGETLHDTMRVVSDYADLIVIRHPKEGAARLAAEVSAKPVINAGDGANQHPTQALLDLFTIQECQQRLDGLAIALVGDLKYGRTIHSFAQACMLFDIRLFLVSPDSLTLPETICDTLKKVGVRFSFHQSIEEVIPKVDILYMTRIQQERFSDAEYQKIRKQCILRPEMLKAARPNLKVLHPLPRVNEIEVEVDRTPYAYYFEQAANGVYVRQALLALLLNQDL